MQPLGGLMPLCSSASQAESCPKSITPGPHPRSSAAAMAPSILSGPELQLQAPHPTVGEVGPCSQDLVVKPALEPRSLDCP